MVLGVINHLTYSPTSRLAQFEAFRRLVKRAHEAGINVILDWVPGISQGYHGLQADGTASYEHRRPREASSRLNTLIYNYGRNEVKISRPARRIAWNVLAQMVFADAVASMIYRDYSRAEGEWISNQQMKT